MVQNPQWKLGILVIMKMIFLFNEKSIWYNNVDEAHEHNVNMDFILTLAKNSLYLNNSIKLIIIMLQ